MNYKEHFAKRPASVPQSQPLSGMIPNSANGFSWPIDGWGRLNRFLILGSEGGTYYIGERALTRENARTVEHCIAADGLRVVAEVVAVSEAGRAPKNDPVLFVLAMCAGLGDDATRQAALAALPRVARIGTHLLHFAEFVEGFRGWGRALRRAIANWYLAMEPERLSLQLVKYKQRDGWSHRDLLRLSHPKTDDESRKALFAWTVQPDNAERVAAAADRFRLIDGMTRLRDAEQALAPDLIRSHSLPREVVPTEMLNDPAVWDALLVDMPMTALIRNLGKMSAIGFLTRGSDVARYVAETLRNGEALRRARVHPLALLIAQKTYASGHGLKGKLTWHPVKEVVRALNDAFYLAFQNVAPAGKRILLALDVSGSMNQKIAGMELMASEASAALALVTAATEQQVSIVCFSSGGWSPSAKLRDRLKAKLGIGMSYGLTPLPISPEQSLDKVMRLTQSMTFGGTDCSLPMLYAIEKNLEIDAFVIYTDNETWAGNIHPSEALRKYRSASRIPAKLIVVGMCSNGFSIANPSDAGMLDVVGFDSAVPALMSDFIRGGGINEELKR